MHIGSIPKWNLQLNLFPFVYDEFEYNNDDDDDDDVHTAHKQCFARDVTVLFVLFLFYYYYFVARTSIRYTRQASRNTIKRIQQYKCMNIVFVQKKNRRRK